MSVLPKKTTNCYKSIIECRIAGRTTYQLVLQLSNGIVQVHLKRKLFAIPKKSSSENKMVANRFRAKKKQSNSLKSSGLA